MADIDTTPETLDFDQIVQDARLACVTADGNLAEIAIFVEALRQVWNARGAADAALMTGWTATTARDAIRALDR
jgi:hypothetical protein